MTEAIRSGAVVFAQDQARLAQFYMALTGLQRQSGDQTHTVLASDAFELVLHARRGEPAMATPPSAREETCVKLFFPVPSLAQARQVAAALGGSLYPPDKEWLGRGFRACDGIDPEGNVIQCREPAR
jgi:predicted enzyme related to lactoylglutathione lyase